MTPAEMATRAEPMLVRAIRRHASSTPAQPALIGEETLTFGQLVVEIDEGALRLREAGVETGQLVVIEADRSVGAIIALLSLWSIGAAYVPVDATAPQPFRREQGRQAGARHVITPSGGGWAIAPEPDHDDMRIPHPPIPGDLPAYGLFTSGTSGNRRCVVVGQRQLEALARSLRQKIYAGMPSGLRIAMNGPLSFDTSVKQLVQLADGHTLVTTPDDVRNDGTALVQHLDENRVDVIDATPSMARRWLDDGALDETSTLRTLLLGGEAVDTDLWQRLATRRDLRTFNLYGPTECTVDVTVADVRGTTPHIGTPLPHAEVSIVDSAGAPVPDFVAGELVVQGEAVAWGYIGEERGGFAGAGPDRRYRTGDRARRRGDGSIEFLGRDDDQVKVHGVRVDLTEVDAALRSAPGVAGAASAVRADGVIVGAVELAPGESLPETTGIRRDLVQRVPLTFVPAELIVVDRIPTTDRGKVDRQAIARLATDLGGQPRGPAETIVATIMGEILGSSPFERGESFFLRGADSLALLELAARLGDDLGQEVDVAALAASATPAAIARLVGSTDARPAPGLGQVVEETEGLRVAAHPLGDAIASGARPALDGAAIVCVPEMARSTLGPGHALRRLVDTPVLIAVRETAQGVLGMVMIPCYPSEAPTVGPGLLSAATRLAATYGARSVALTAELGLLPAEDSAPGVLEGGPLVTAGQASTIAAMASTWEAACRAHGRPTSEERVSVLGRGALLDAFAAYLATIDDSPAEIIRCTGDHPPPGGFTSVVASGLPASSARPTWLGPDTIVVEYGIGWSEGSGSAPSGSTPLVMNGGTLRSVAPIVDTIYGADLLHHLDPDLSRVALVVGQDSIGSCALAALLVAGGEVPPVRGTPRPHQVVAYREAQRALGYLPTLDAA